VSSPAPYRHRLRRPGPCDHVIQLYTDEAFLGRVVGEFLRSGLSAGEAAVIIATPEHVSLFRQTLSAAGADVAAAEAAGRLVIRDAQQSLAQFMIDGMPDRDRFFVLTKSLLHQITTRGYPKVRLYGEMVDLLWNRSMPATVALEELWNEVLADTGASLLCAYGIDNFDRHVHRGILHQITACHSELIPVEDYDRLGQAIVRAYEDVFGDSDDAALLRNHVASEYKERTAMPGAQAALLGLRDLAPVIADSVIDRARHYYRRQRPG
jgi:MEDS: MEthanogen/methylotroph, DcmR Sensory domain